jgi:hypothetical protein
MGSIQIEMRHKRNPNPNPKDAGVLPRRHVGSAILDLHDGLREGHRATAHPPPLVGLPACRLRSQQKGTTARRLDGGSSILL